MATVLRGKCAIIFDMGKVVCDALRIGLRSLRANVVPLVVLWGFAAALAVSYYTVPEVAEALEPTKFVGYDSLTAEAKVVAIICENKLVDSVSLGDAASVVLDVTPFYGESGGQVGDCGTLSGEGGTSGEVQGRTQDGERLRGLSTFTGWPEIGTANH